MRISPVRLMVAAVVLTVIVAVGLSNGPSGAGAATTGTLPGAAFYPRVIRLADGGTGNGTILATTNADVVGRIWRSTDDGNTFDQLADIDPGPDAVGLCCIELFEFPVDLDPFPAGTLLWAGSVTTDVGPPRQMELRVWRSDDGGGTWTAMAPCATSTAGGLWEPEFRVANDGSLVCTYSDESQRPAHSQVLAQTISTDGAQTWSAPSNIVARDKPWQRPGMGTTVKLPDGSWVMTYEVCAAFPNCGIWLRRSADGVDWGRPNEPGERVTATDGSYLAHTPVLAWSPAGGGTLILSGQLLFEADHEIAPGNGRTLHVTNGGGRSGRRFPSPTRGTTGAPTTPHRCSTSTVTACCSASPRTGTDRPAERRSARPAST